MSRSSLRIVRVCVALATFVSTFGCSKDNNVTTGTCTAGDLRCEGNILQTCMSDGTWGNDVDCKSAVCSAQTKKCEPTGAGGTSGAGGAGGAAGSGGSGGASGGAGGSGGTADAGSDPCVANTQANPSTNCKSLFSAGCHADGAYWITADGTHTAFPAWCEMETQAGGWTLCLNTAYVTDAQILISDPSLRYPTSDPVADFHDFCPQDMEEYLFGLGKTSGSSIELSLAAFLTGIGVHNATGYRGIVATNVSWVVKDLSVGSLVSDCQGQISTGPPGVTLDFHHTGYARGLFECWVGDPASEYYYLGAGCWGDTASGCQGALGTAACGSADDYRLVASGIKMSGTTCSVQPVSPSPLSNARVLAFYR